MNAVQQAGAAWRVSRSVGGGGVEPRPTSSTVGGDTCSRAGLSGLSLPEDRSLPGGDSRRAGISPPLPEKRDARSASGAWIGAHGHAMGVPSEGDPLRRSGTSAVSPLLPVPCLSQRRVSCEAGQAFTSPTGRSDPARSRPSVSPRHARKPDAGRRRPSPSIQTRPRILSLGPVGRGSTPPPASYWASTIRSSRRAAVAVPSSSVTVTPRALAAA